MAFNIYYINYPKVYEIKMMFDNFITVAKEVQKMYSAYSTHTPKIEDLFFLGYSKGQAITIGGWINERTTIR